MLSQMRFKCTVEMTFIENDYVKLIISDVFFFLMFIIFAYC